MTFAEFWLAYLRAHSDRRTRAAHVIGTLAGSAMVLSSIVGRKPWLLLAGIIAGYAPAWLSHALIERNKPETFRAPLFSLGADYVMVWHVLRGTIDAEIATASEGKGQ
ncbi:MAG: DUF962 domain-containing protein [Candidatus Eremiobacteraeota bacterium]|nr:DUF962 domain-containing protein [Candidatus Eremiobacteraeota bacterium]